MKRFFEKSAYVAALILVFTMVISCETDFTDIGSSIISNTKFDTSSLLVDVEIENDSITKVTSDNISFEPGQYLLGVHASTDYEKIEASIISQLLISSSLQVVDDANVYVSDTTVVTTIDTVFIKLPYQVTLNDDSDGYDLDSIIGDPTKAFNLNVYQINKYLSRLNPADPAKINTYNSKDDFLPTGNALNVTDDFKFLPTALTDSIVVNRWLSNGVLATKDTVTYTTSTTSTLKLPFATIPLKEDRIKELFLDKYESSEFDSQDAFNNYFRGIILEATGNEGSLLSLNFNGTVKPSIEVYYTNTVLTAGAIIDTIYKNDSFLLSGIRASQYQMEDGNDKKYPENENVILQGTAGNEAIVNIFGDDIDGNGIADKIEELRDRDSKLLINDASLTFYINESADITALPHQLYLYKSNEDPTNPVYSLIKDVYTEGLTSFGGLLEEDEDGTNKRYTFKITDYISDILSEETNYSPSLRLKVVNQTDLAAVTSIADTIFNNYSWNPKAVTLYNHSTTVDGKKAALKISYSEEKN